MDGMGDDAGLQLMAALSGIPLEQAALMQRARRAQGLMDTPGAQGQQIGQVYRAASPLEHIATALNRYKGGKQMKELEPQFDGLAQRAQQGGLEQMRMERGDKDRAFGLQERGLERQTAADAAAQAARAADDARQTDGLTETKRHNRAIEARPPSMPPVIYGQDGTAYVRDPRNPAAAAPVVDTSSGQPIQKPAGGHGGGMAEVAERKRTMLSDGQLKTVAQYDIGLETLRDISEKKKSIDTGPLASGKNALAAKIGADDPKISAFRAAVGDQLAVYIRGLSGAAVSDRERAFLIQNIPKMEDNDQVFEAKLALVSDRLARLREIEVELFGKQGKDVEAFRAGAVPSSEAPSAPRRRRYNPATGALE
jgi:hypothetical protein